MLILEVKVMERMISISEASEILGVDIRTLQRWDNDGRLKAYRTLGGHRRYKLSEIESLFTNKELEKEKGENSENND